MANLERDELKKALRGEMVTRFIRSNVHNIHKEINEKLKVFELTHGIKITVPRLKFDDLSFKGKIEGRLLQTESGESVEQIRFRSYCLRYNLKPSDYGKEIKFNHGRFAGRTGKIYGINPKAKTFPILIRLEDGQLIKTTAASVR